MDARSVMTDKLVTVCPDASLLCAIDLMLDHGLSALPVVDTDGRAIGVLSETDLLCRAELETGAVSNDFWSKLSHQKSAAAFVRLHGRRVRDVMTTQVCSVLPEATMAEIVGLMREHDMRRLYVVENGNLAGVVSERDVMKALRDILGKPEVALSDEAILAQLRSQLSEARWAPQDVHAEVQDGAVIWHGVARDEEDIAALKAMAQNIPGVKSVKDNLFLLSPGTGYARPESGTSE